MSKVLIFSDIHINQHKKSSERLEDCIKTLEWVFQTAIDQGIKNILFLGDLFHERQKIEVMTYQRTFEVFEKFHGRKGGPAFQTHLLLGNHDLWHLNKWDISSVIPLRSIPGVTVIDKPSTVEVDGFSVSFLPYTHDPESDIKLLKNDAKFKMLCGHVAIDGAVWNVMHGTTAEVAIENDGEMKKVDCGVFKGWDQVFLGHYHKEQKLDNNIEYVGSPLQLSFGEAFQHKHIIIYDLKTHEKKYIRNTFSPQHFIIPHEDLDKYDLNNNFIRLIVDDLSMSDTTELNREILAKSKPASLQIKQAEKKISETLVEDAKAILFKEGEMLQKYVELQEKQGLDGLDKVRLLEIGNVICAFNQN